MQNFSVYGAREVHELRMRIRGSAGFSSLWNVDEGLPGNDLAGREWLVSARPAISAGSANRKRLKPTGYRSAELP
jgi:hypothetical protein